MRTKEEGSLINIDGKICCSVCGATVKPLTSTKLLAWLFGGSHRKHKHSVKPKNVPEYRVEEYQENLYPNPPPATIESEIGGYSWRDEIRSAPTSDWMYSQHTDITHGRTVYFANKNSVNTVLFDYPYDEAGGSTLGIEVRQTSDRLTSVAIKISSGQITNGNTFNSMLRVRFDDGAVECYKWEKPTPDSHVVVIYKDAAKFIENLQNSQHLMIEMDFYIMTGDTSEVFKFDVSDLKLKMNYDGNLLA